MAGGGSHRSYASLGTNLNNKCSLMILISVHNGIDNQLAAGQGNFPPSRLIMCINGSQVTIDYHQSKVWWFHDSLTSQYNLCFCRKCADVILYYIPLSNASMCVYVCAVARCT